MSSYLPCMDWMPSMNMNGAKQFWNNLSYDDFKDCVLTTWEHLPEPSLGEVGISLAGTAAIMGTLCIGVKTTRVLLRRKSWLVINNPFYRSPQTEFAKVHGSKLVLAAAAVTALALTSLCGGASMGALVLWSTKAFMLGAIVRLTCKTAQEILGLRPLRDLEETLKNKRVDVLLSGAAITAAFFNLPVCALVAIASLGFNSAGQAYDRIIHAID